MEKVGIGVIGLGVFGERHIKIYASLHNARLVAVCSRNAERAAEIAGRYGFLRWYTDVGDVVTDAEVDAVVVTTEPERHAAPALAALQAGKHVLVEKPIATTLEDADRLLSAAEQHKVQLMVGHTMRFDVRYGALKEQVELGHMGRIVSVYARRNGVRSLFLGKKTYHPVLDSLIHDIDLIHWLTEDKVHSVYAVLRNTIEAHRPDLCWAIMQLASGAIGVLESSMSLSDRAPVGFDAYLEVIGDKGVGQVRVPEQSVSFWLEDRATAPDLGTWPLLRDLPVGALCEELRYFINCVQRDQPITQGTPAQARRALSTALAVIRSAEQGKEIVLA